MDIMLAIEQEELQATGTPSERDQEVGGLCRTVDHFQHHRIKFIISPYNYVIYQDNAVVFTACFKNSEDRFP